MKIECNKSKEENVVVYIFNFKNKKKDHISLVSKVFPRLSVRI